MAVITRSDTGSKESAQSSELASPQRVRMLLGLHRQVRDPDPHQASTFLPLDDGGVVEEALALELGSYTVNPDVELGFVAAKHSHQILAVSPSSFVG